ncbi:MAG: amidohydrolase [Gemmatimonadota bacterium]
MHTHRMKAIPAGAATLALALLLTACGGATRPDAADLVLRNGKVVTVDDARPEADAVAIAGDTIVAVGDDVEIEPYIGSGTRVIDLDGALAVPGFIEGHGHFLGLGRAQMILDLTTATSWAEIVEMVAAAVAEAEPGDWIEGRGWHQEKWDPPPERLVEGLPTHDELSRVSRDNPVVLGHASGHASFVNAAALERAGITAGTPDPDGGEIVRDPQTDEPTGALRETAQGLVGRALAEWRAERSPDEIEAEFRRRVELAARDALSKGVTTFHDAGSSFETIDGLRRMADEGELPIRLYVMVRGESNETMADRLPDYRMTGYGDGFLTVRSIKEQVDGALGSHGAWLLEPYSDLTRSTGLVLEPVEDLERTAQIAIEHGFQLNVHAIGDRANREILDLYERTFEAHDGATDDLRWRIEHAQHLTDADIGRFAELGVVASMQGIHACSDAPWVPERLGLERAREGGYVWQKLWQSGAVVTNGTDAPVEDVDPLASFACTVARTLPDGSVFFEGQADQRLTRLQALESYTINSAYAAFEEDVKGSISPGKLADIAVLSRDIMTVPAEEIADARVLYTILDGEVVYEAPAGAVQVTSADGLDRPYGADGTVAANAAAGGGGEGGEGGEGEGGHGG